MGPLKGSGGNWAKQAAPGGAQEYGDSVWWNRFPEGGLEHRDRGCSRLLDTNLYPDRKLSAGEEPLLGYPPDQLLEKLGCSQASGGGVWLGKGVGWLEDKIRIRIP